MRVMGAADARVSRKCTEDAWSIHISANQVQTDMMGPQTMKTGPLHIRGVTCMCVPVTQLDLGPTGHMG